MNALPNPPPPPPLARSTALLLLTVVTLAAGLALVAGPAAAQTFTIPGNFDYYTQVLENEGRDHGNPVTSLNGPLFTDTQATSALRDLDIEAKDWPGTAAIGVGATSRCAYGSGNATRLVEFHRETDKYTHGQPIATACPHWGQPKCSRTVTVSVPGHGNQTFTANRGSPPCPPNPQQGADNVPASRHIPHTGMFTVRIWGKVCFSGSGFCQSAGEPISAGDGRPIINGSGYFATFKGGGNNCGPPIWPTPEARALGAPPYAAWCDFTFNIQ